MSILVVGSVAYDSVQTPFGKVDEALGGSAVFFAAAASFFAPVRLVAVVGADYDLKALEFLSRRGVDLTGLTVEPGLTFRWAGVYAKDMNDRETLYTHLNVFEKFRPVLPPQYQDSQFVFLANIAPELQYSVLEQVKKPRLVVMDTMNFWIHGSLAALKQTLQKVDILLINDSEAKDLAGESNLFKAARKIRTMGPQTLVIKKGEHGAILIHDDQVFMAPAYPLETVFDPTGAGDTFAGGFVGYLAQQGKLSHQNLRRAVIYGSAYASFSVEKFSIDRLRDLGAEEVEQRVQDFKKLVDF